MPGPYGIALPSPCAPPLALLLPYNATHAPDLRAGNYVIQYLVENGTDADASLVMQAVVGFTAQLSQQKYSSNVVEKCLAKASMDIRARMLQEISVPAVMQVLLFHRFANYVVQRALKVATPDERALLVAAIRPHASGLMHNAGGRRILDVGGAVHDIGQCGKLYVNGTEFVCAIVRARACVCSYAVMI